MSVTCQRTTAIAILIPRADVITALKLRFPGVIDIEALPPNGAGVGMTADSSGSLKLSYLVAAGRND